jgi:hypothetical protein
MSVQHGSVHSSDIKETDEGQGIGGGQNQVPSGVTLNTEEAATKQKN